MPHDTRDTVVDFVRTCAEKPELAVERLARWLGLQPARSFDWRARYGKVLPNKLRDGVLPFDAGSGDLLYNVIAERHQRHSTVTATNPSFKVWIFSSIYAFDAGWVTDAPRVWRLRVTTTGAKVWSRFQRSQRSARSRPVR